MSSETQERRLAQSALGTVVATVTGNLYLVVGTILFSIVALIVSCMPSGRRRVFRVSQIWSRGVLFFGGVRLESSFERRLDPAASYVFLSNHQSLFDIPALLASLPSETHFLAKQSLFRIPLFGWAIKRGGFVTVDRADGRRARAGFDDAIQQLEDGVSILVFPEGTRSYDGELLPFKRGGLLLALRAGRPILPVGVSGTLAVRPRDSWTIRPGIARVRYGAPLDPKAYGMRRRRELEDEVRHGIRVLAGLD